jgi:hypothetical protein
MRLMFNCRSLTSWRLWFQVYDCDFNQQLGMTMGVDSIHTRGGWTGVFDIETLDELLETRIRTDNHCFGCTAGM